MQSPKVVFDTNVLISAFVFEGQSAKSVEYCIEHTEVYISVWIINELKEKLFEKFRLSNKEVKTIESLILSEFHLHQPVTSLPAVCRDADDNHVLQLAESSMADYIITGDKDLLVLKKYKSTAIVSPSIFVELAK